MTRPRGVRAEPARRPIAYRAIRARLVLEGAIYLLLCALTAWSAVMVKEAGAVRPLAQVSGAGAVAPMTVAVAAGAGDLDAPESVESVVPVAVAVEPPSLRPDERLFDGRPIRPAYTMRMKVTAYSPDARSTAPFDDGLTATLHSVETNGGRLVAADTRLLPFGSLVSVPGYHGGEPVPVLDRGAAIKGHRLDLLYPTHRRALRWGVQWLDVVVWEYADGAGIVDPRKKR